MAGQKLLTEEESEFRQHHKKNKPNFAFNEARK
jgi:hypothetical protein